MYINQDTEDKLSEFFSKFPLREFPKKTVIINDATDPEGVFYLEDGKIRQYTMDRKGNEVTVNIFHNHTMVPMSWVLNDARNEYYYDSLIDSHLRVAPKEKVREFLQSDPEMLFELLSGVFRRLDNTYMRIVHLMSSSAYVRILHILAVQANRKMYRSHNGRDIVIKFMSYDLAAYCGLSKETVSREFKKLKQNNIAFMTAHGVKIPSLAKLEAELQKHLQA